MVDVAKNKEILFSKQGYLEEVWETEDETEVIHEQTLDGREVLGVVQGEHIFYLSSRYSMKEAEEWVAAQEIEENPFRVFVMFGIGDGNYLKELFAQHPDNEVILFEPSEEIFRKSLECIDYEELMTNHKLYLCVGDGNKGALVEYLEHLIPYAKCMLTNVMVHPNYERLFKLEYLRFLVTYHDAMSKLVFLRNTYVLYEHEHVYNFFRNVNDYIKQYSFCALRDTFIKKVGFDYPIIIVSAGPSLDKNIHELKRAKNHAFIISTDTAIKPLIKAGITPDLLVTVDPHKPLSLFEHEIARTVPWLVENDFNTKLLDIHKGKRFYYQGTIKFLSPIARRYRKSLMGLESGGSVACVACYAAVVLGVKNIILIGQDLAYPNNQLHATASYDGKEKAELPGGRLYFEVEDVYGGKVMTEMNMNFYRKWFENMTKRFDHLNFVDATEGGAKIHGTEIITLREAIDKYANLEREINFEKIIDDIPNYFDEKQQEEIMEYFKQIPAKLDHIEKRIHKGIEYANQIKKDKELKYKKTQVALRRVLNLIKYIDRCPEEELIGMYNQAKDFDIQGKSLQMKEEHEDEMLAIANLSLETFEHYLASMDKLRKDLPLLWGEDITNES